MSYNENIILENDLIGETSNPALFKTYFDGKITNLQNELSIENEILKRKSKRTLLSNSKERVIRFSFNCDILSDLAKLQKKIKPDDTASVNVVSGIILKINKRNKLIRITDKSPAGGKTFREYESDDLVSDSEDEKRLCSAENRALRQIKEQKKRPHRNARNSTSDTVFRSPLQRLHLILRFVTNSIPFGTTEEKNHLSTTYATTVTNLVTGGKTAHLQTQKLVQQQQKNSNMKEKLTLLGSIISPTYRFFLFYKSKPLKKRLPQKVNKEKVKHDLYHYYYNVFIKLFLHLTSVFGQQVDITKQKDEVVRLHNAFRKVQRSANMNKLTQLFIKKKGKIYLITILNPL
ncbi:hypothetical protein KUTeg_016078 [Tegillarca granosa]|uniref:Uncharacterized protein n=1 Tax=Tegillarca granosa TaxID=220873 RepID=A0ABQ9EQI3_TEGGR|nr:hypothetical protein KUTeg_016078 [Tegillarca granosa]